MMFGYNELKRINETMSSTSQHYSAAGNVEAILERLKRALGIKADAELAAVFGVSRSQISGYKADQTVPYRHLDQVCQDRGLSLEWVLRGTGPQQAAALAKIAETPAAYAVGIDFDLYHRLTVALRPILADAGISDAAKTDHLVAYIYNDVIKSPDHAIDIDKIKQLIRIIAP
jgi:transcriptional regulator with XRE-family HTH domain